MQVILQKKILEVVNRLASPYLGACYDSGHANLIRCDRGIPDCVVKKAWEGYGSVQWDDSILEKLQSVITTCHLHDNNGLYDEHIIPGRGEIDWYHVVGLLKNAPRLKYIQCEVAPVRTGSSISDICRSMRNLFP